MQGPGKTKRITGALHRAEEPAAVRTARPAPYLGRGAMIADKYRIEREIGRGGFGVVVSALHLGLDQRVAIKVLTEGEGAGDAEWAEDNARFRREAAAMAALRNDHVVRVLDVDVLDSGFPYIVMEYLDGKTLHELTYASPQSLRFEQVADYAIQVLAALAEAHAVGIVHRDLKPANVFLAKGMDGMPLVKVLDFGVSKIMTAGSQRLTRTGAVVGTVAYMAPEQLLDAKRVDGRADLWSLAMVLYESLARSHPFGAASAGPTVVTAILQDPIPPLRDFRPDAPPGLEAIIMRLLEKSADRRFSTAIAAAEALAPFASSRSRPVLEGIRRAPPPSGAAAPGLDTRPTKEISKSGKSTSPLVGFLVALVTAVVVLGGIAAAVFGARRIGPSTPVASSSLSGLAPRASAPTVAPQPVSATSTGRQPPAPASAGRP